jgi:hypothetical protein
MPSNEEATLAGDISPVNQQLRRRVVLCDLMDCLVAGGGAQTSIVLHS